MIQGIGASSGIAIGKAFVLPTWEWDLPDQRIDSIDLAKEFERLYEGVRTSKNEIEFLKNEFREVVGPDQSSIFDAHIAILEDPVFMSEIQAIIERQYKAAEVAVKEAIDHFVKMFDLLDDEYMKERALDIKDVGNRLLKHLLGAPEITLPSDTNPYLLVAKELSPSQLANLNQNYVLGIATLQGGRTSHSAIMARALGIPFVLGLEGKLDDPIQTGDMLVVDGGEGTVYVNPDEEILQRYTQIRDEQMEKKNRLRQLASVPAVTLDGIEMRLAANISSLKELNVALSNGASGVGLFRTEFLYMDRQHFPEEEEQFDVYREVAEKVSPNTVVIRTLDIGGDKHLDYFALPEEDNPFLGYRAIRICLDRKGLFKTQLRAILRASHFGNVKIMYPMISSLDEVREANEVLEEAKRELDLEGIPYNSHIQVGIMVEVPAAVMIADLLAEEVDFFSIGTNDLVQYVLAVDRMNEKIAHMYNPFHPSILRMLKMTVDAAKAKGIAVSVCGELAGDERALALWVALGVHDLSMSAHSILHLKSRVLEMCEKECVELKDRLFSCRTNREIEQLLNDFTRNKS
ncbi:phosphoenolpyruvate--protein phosphotransferase [Paenibacillus terrigena]|uniref:phosphoenolpyruvate--protein phosphotransferase n=1 Tax=Paenibacillus terrigena TaxID=369333 RepID=UPI0028D75C38|nr:phosphoenolpyruvate--protein phosphotransferase [Paenibacillus terrigena]